MVLEKTLESPLDCKEIQPVHPKGNQSWIFIGRTNAETPIFGHLMQRTDSLEKTLLLGKLKAGGEGDAKGWDGWMASLIRWTWVWWTSQTSSGSWWWTGRPGVLQSIGLQRVQHNWVPELNWNDGFSASSNGIHHNQFSAKMWAMEVSFPTTSESWPVMGMLLVFKSVWRLVIASYF